MTRLLPVLAFAALLASCPARADTLRVAVAANFTIAMKRLIERFEQQSPHKIAATYGASGKFVSQIQQGAPFDALLAADENTAQHLITAGLADPASRITYATGQLVLWSADKTLIDGTDKVLHSGKFSRLALAQPKLAPYGVAAQQVLRNLKLWPAVQGKLVFGENVAQSWQFVESGNAELGFVALAQLLGRPGGSHWRVPPALHAPIRQQGVLLKNSPNRALGQQFWQFLQSEPARQLIGNAGYQVQTP